MTFGEKVAYLRNKKGLTVRQLAIEAGVSQNVILQYEKDEYRPKLPVMYEVLSEIFGCSEDALMDDSVDIITQDTESQDTAEPDDTESSDMEPDDITENSDPTINNKETKMTFGEKLSFLRNLKGLSPSQVADAIGVSRNAISNYESGSRRPRNVGIYRALANLLGCTIEELKDDSVSIIPDDPHEKSKAAPKSSGKDKKADEVETETAPEMKAEAPAKVQSTPVKVMPDDPHEKSEKVADKKEAPQKPADDKKASDKIADTEKASDKKSDTEKNPTPAKAMISSGDMTFGEKLHNLRTEKGLSLTQISDAIGIKKGAYSGMEYKNSRPTDVKVYDKLAEVLGCDVEYLTEGDKRFEKDSAVEKNAVSEAPAKKDTEKSTKAPADKTAPAETNSAPINIEETLPSDASFGKKLSTLRKQKGLTLAQMAEKLGINVDAYKQLEYRNGRPRDPKIYNKLAKVLGCPVDYLREGDKRFEKAAPVSAPIEKTEKPAPIKETATVENKAIEAPITEAAPIEKQIVSASSKSSELIKLVSRLSVLLSSDEIGKDEKDAVMASLNGAYWIGK